jgi:tetratricopeptide (TPR) repeat protein
MPSGVALGVFPGERAGESAVDDFAQMSGTEVDIWMDFMAFSTGLHFPADRARSAQREGRTIFLKLEPWSFGGTDDQSFSLQSIVDGQHDTMLRRFAREIRDFGYPVMLSFGHEMNADWYPWGNVAGNTPELYAAAFRHVHDVIEDIACNVNWVWNPNVSDPGVASMQRYYPGDAYVDWVGLDAYQFAGSTHRSPRELFARDLPFLRSLHRPIMIGETATGDDDPAWQTELIGFVTDPANGISALIYFNFDKTERGRRQEFAVSAGAEQQAFRTAIAQHQAAFASGLTAPETPPTEPATPVGAPGEPLFPILPPAFDFRVISPTTLRAANEEKINESNGPGRAGSARDSMRAYQEYVERCRRRGVAPMEGASGNLGQDRTIMFQELVIQWILQRENGASPTVLNALLHDSIGYIRDGSPYWRTKAALLIATGNPNPQEVAFLQALGFHPNGSRYDLLLEISRSYPETPTALQAQEGQPDPLLLAELAVQLALNATPNSSEAHNHFATARRYLDRIIRDPELGGRIVRERMQRWLGANASPELIEGETTNYQGQSRLLMAQVIMQETGTMRDPQQIFQELTRVHNFLSEAARNLDGLHALQVRRLAAECLIQMGFLAKDYPRQFDQDTNSILTDLRSWEERAYGQRSAAAWQTFFHAAEMLIENAPDESILAWERDYNNLRNAQDQPLNPPLWLRQISAFAQVWQLKMKMVAIGEDRRGAPREYLPRQSSALRTVTDSIRTLLTERRDTLDARTIADLNRLLAESLVRQAFIQRDLGEEPSVYTPLLAEATALLTELTAEDSAANPYTRAEANFWLAKITLVQAGDRATDAEIQTDLTRAETYVRAAIDSGRLWGPTLSSAYQTLGEIQQGQRNPEAARASLAAALQTYPNNYEARLSYADVLSQLEDYDGASEQYTQARRSPNLQLQQRAALGLAEVNMRRGESYSEENVQATERAAQAILDSAPLGSFLIPRAIRALIEANSSTESLQSRVIELCRRYRETRTLPARFRAWLYLKEAEATTWQGRAHLREAADILASIPADLQALIAQDDLVLHPTEQLLRAELEMRNRRRSAPVRSPQLQALVMASRDPDLITRLLMARVEGYSYEQNFRGIIDFTRQQLAEENWSALTPLFDGRNVSLLRLRLRLWESLINGLTWDRQYQPALDAITAFNAEIDRLPSTAAETADLYRNRVQVTQADILRYQRRFTEARTAYQTFLEANTDDSNAPAAGRIIIARAELGLGEIYRYGMGRPQRAAARQHYETAQTILISLPEDTPDRELLLAQVYLGLANLSRGEDGSAAGRLQANYEQAAEYLGQALQYYDAIDDPPEELARDIQRLAGDPDITSRLQPEVNVMLQYMVGSDRRSETRLRLGTELPLSLFGVRHASWLRFRVGEDFAIGPAGNSYSTRLGLEFRPHSSTTITLEGGIPNNPEVPPLRFFQQPELVIGFQYWHRRVMFAIEANMEIQGEDYNELNRRFMALTSATTSISVPFAPESDHEALRGLRAVVQGYTGPSVYGQSTFRLWQASVGLSYEHTFITSLARVSVIARAMFLNNFRDCGGEVGCRPWSPGLAVEAGLSIDFNRHFSVEARGEAQVTEEYALFNLMVMLVGRF